MASQNSQRKTKQTIALFIATFLVTLVGVVYLIKSFSPNVDVEIGGEEEYEQADDIQSDPKQAVDDRLKWIQLEDNMPGVSKRAENEESEEITYEPADENTKLEHNRHNETVTEETYGNEITLDTQTTQEQVRPQTRPAPPVPPAPKLVQPEVYKMTKVYVGNYSTIEQAIQAQNKLMETSIGISPFVKNIGGVYVLQAGSFASVQKAESVASQLNQAGFSARVVQE